MSIYDYQIKTADNKTISMKNYRGNVLLIVNTATGCGFTPQYEELEELYQKHNKDGFDILDFPCNQFGNQAPGSNSEITAFCQLTYHTSFQTFGKINVNGKEEDPLYTFLKQEQGGLAGSSIKWNFTKFLVDQNGTVIKRYGSTTKPFRIEADIMNLLKK